LKLSETNSWRTWIDSLTISCLTTQWKVRSHLCSLKMRSKSMWRMQNNNRSNTRKGTKKARLEITVIMNRTLKSSRRRMIVMLE
jgi:hypothetical protein